MVGARALALVAFGASIGRSSATLYDAEESSCLADGCESDTAALLQQVKSHSVVDAEGSSAGDGSFNYTSLQELGWDFPMCLDHVANPWQAPINIATGVDYPELAVSEPPKFTVIDGGCKEVTFKSLPGAWQVNFDCPNLQMEWKGKTYYLVQFHFHTRSEDSFDFNRFPAQMHMVHSTVPKEGEQPQYAVIGVQLQTKVGLHGENMFLKHIFHTGFPAEVGEKKVVSARPYNPYAGVLSSRGKFWYYQGSFTTPPCTGGVDFLVAQESVTVCASVITDFAAYLSSGDRVGDSYGQNARPIQPLNGRQIEVGAFGQVLNKPGEGSAAATMAPCLKRAFELGKAV